MSLAVVIPAAADSPWLAASVASAQAQGGVVFVVSEGVAIEGATAVQVAEQAGFAARANAGLAAAAGAGFEQALLLNDDTELAPGALDHLARSARPNRVLGAVLIHWDGGGVQQAGLSVRGARVRARTALAEGLSPVDAVGGAAMGIPLALWTRLGGFDEGYHFYFEDLDFCLRARAEGAEILLVNAARVRHRGGGTRSHRSAAAAFHLGRSHARFSRSLGGGRGARAGRLLWTGTLGLGWTLRSVGVAGVASFLRGLAEGARLD